MNSNYSTNHREEQNVAWQRMVSSGGKMYVMLKNSKLCSLPIYKLTK